MQDHQSSGALFVLDHCSHRLGRRQEKEAAQASGGRPVVGTPRATCRPWGLSAVFPPRLVHTCDGHNSGRPTIPVGATPDLKLRPENAPICQMSAARTTEDHMPGGFLSSTCRFQVLRGPRILPGR